MENGNFEMWIEAKKSPKLASEFGKSVKTAVLLFAVPRNQRRFHANHRGRPGTPARRCAQVREEPLGGLRGHVGHA